jgi:signal transduction histidine kinase
MRVLFIEDSPRLQGTVSAALRRSGYAVDLRALLAAVCQPLQARASARQVALDVLVAAPVEIERDPACVRLVVANLVENAVEYAPTGGAVRLQAAANNGRFDLRVVNRAEQLTPADLPHWFERFWRKDNARTGADHAGLGLSLARSLATSLGCTLTAALPGEACLSLTLSGPMNPPPPPSGLSAMSVTKTLPGPESTRP